MAECRQFLGAFEELESIRADDAAKAAGEAVPFTRAVAEIDGDRS